VRFIENVPNAQNADGEVRQAPHFTINYSWFAPNG
jgi:hypothetical protein